MNTLPTSSCHSPLCPDTQRDLREQALQRAVELREQAVDDFWRGANQVLVRSFSQVGRSARRLAARVARHALIRASAR